MSNCINHLSNISKRTSLYVVIVNYVQRKVQLPYPFRLCGRTEHERSFASSASVGIDACIHRLHSYRPGISHHTCSLKFRPNGYFPIVSFLASNLSVSSTHFSESPLPPSLAQEYTTADIMDLKKVVKKLNKFAPTSLAESWDNVGLLVEPTPPHQVNTLFLTNDLTEEVLEEAIKREADMILAYHPPIFSALKRLTMRSEKERIIVRAIEKRIAIYSPHTSYDAVEGGVNDWLASGLEFPRDWDEGVHLLLFAAREAVQESLGFSPFELVFGHQVRGPLQLLKEKWLQADGNGKVEPLHPSYTTCYPTPGGYKLEFLDSEQGLTHALSSVQGVTDIMLCVNDNAVRMRASMNCTMNGLTRALEIVNADDDVKKTVQITQLTKPPIPHTGIGRLCTLEEDASLSTVLQRVKGHLKLTHVQLAIGKEKTMDSPVQTAAVCAGSGGTVLKGTLADLYVTGEMSHHEVLAAVAQGTSVILCNHSNTERGFLRVLKEKFNKLYEEKIYVIVSQVDADPLNVV